MIYNFTKFRVSYPKALTSRMQTFEKKVVLLCIRRLSVALEWIIGLKNWRRKESSALIGTEATASIFCLT